MNRLEKILIKNQTYQKKNLKVEGFVGGAENI